MPLIEVEPGISIYADDIGEGRPVVLLPGFGMCHQVFAVLSTALAAQYRVVTIDIRGTGDSDKPRIGYEVSRLSADVESVISALGLTDITIVGWSFGGQIALDTVSRWPEQFAQLVLLASNGVGVSRTESFPFGKAAGEIEPGLIAAELNDPAGSRLATILASFRVRPEPEVIDLLLESSLKMPTWSAVESFRSFLRTDLSPVVENITLPTLQILGTEDPTLSRRGASWVRGRLKNARLVNLEGAGHYPMLQAPGALEETLRSFLAEVPWSKTTAGRAGAGSTDA
ncbi:alpha/beta fold hydrolase [Specibacter sp. RAF43]|uniref:alpha/beta fold hydrolase n=1 Tax=Specibacter sp. RAF43 TaxID=3233057 RepID=UPI003F9D56CA